MKALLRGIVSLLVILAFQCTLTYPVVVDIPPKWVVHRECLQTRTQSTSLQKNKDPRFRHGYRAVPADAIADELFSLHLDK